MDNLNERKKLILKAIVEAHVRNGEPVGSTALTRRDGFSISSATIRNEMAELERMGYLEQPHTSSGRVPSESGYRFYVDSLMQHYDMQQSEIARLSALARSRLAEVDKLLDTATKLAAALTNYSSIAVRPKGSAGVIDSFRLEHFYLVVFLFFASPCSDINFLGIACKGSEMPFYVAGSDCSQGAASEFWNPVAFCTAQHYFSITTVD